jgi:ATP-dependent Clp protease ATP-binding subunit ClpC
MDGLIDMLPDDVSTSIKKHLYKESFIDSLQLAEMDEDDITMFELTIDELLTDVHEMSFDIERVRGLPLELNTKVIGQSHAADHLYAIIRRLAVGFRDVNKPPAVLLFAGPTGVGKTLMAKVATDYLFGTKNKFGRIDCANLSEKHDVSKLVGAPPGYVGYPSDRGGDPKEQDPAVIYREVSKMGQDGGVLLLDEVEKAHPDIWDTFLTAFDEGYVKTSVGNVVDLRNVVIIMTTNLGSKEFDDMQRKNPLGFNTKDVCAMDDETDAQELIKTIKRTASEALRDYMKPELIGRITDVVPFMNLNESGLKDVAELEWDKARVYLTEKLPEIHITEELKEHIAASAANKKLGARPVQRMIEQYAVDAVAEIYVEYPEKVENTEQIIIDISDNNGFCDTVNVILGESEYEYEVKQTLSDD